MLWKEDGIVSGGIDSARHPARLDRGERLDASPPDELSRRQRDELTRGVGGQSIRYIGSGDEVDVVMGVGGKGLDKLLDVRFNAAHIAGPVIEK